MIKDSPIKLLKASRVKSYFNIKKKARLTRNAKKSRLKNPLSRETRKFIYTI